LCVLIIPNIIDEIPILSIAGLFAEGKFEIKNAFDSRNSEYFEFIKETSLDIMRLKISNESPDHYIYITQFTNKIITILIRDPEAFGITKLELAYENNDFELKSIENLPSNPYTNPMCELSSN